MAYSTEQTTFFLKHNSPSFYILILIIFSSTSSLFSPISYTVTSTAPDIIQSTLPSSHSTNNIGPLIPLKNWQQQMIKLKWHIMKWNHDHEQDYCYSLSYLEFLIVLHVHIYPHDNIDFMITIDYDWRACSGCRYILCANDFFFFYVHAGRMSDYDLALVPCGQNHACMCLPITLFRSYLYTLMNKLTYKPKVKLSLCTKNIMLFQFLCCVNS